MQNHLVVAAIDDPYDARTWSGTPRALIYALSEAGYEVTGVTADQPMWYDKPLYSAFGPAIYGRGGRAFRCYYGFRHRRLCEKASNLRKNNPQDIILHTDQMWVPFDGMGEKDCLFRDAPWSAYAESQNLGYRLAKRIGKDFGVALGVAGHTFTTSDWARSGLIREGASDERTTVVGSGVGNLIQPFFGRKDYRNKRTLCVAKVRLLNKGVDLLLDGFQRARTLDPELTLDLVVPKDSVTTMPGVTLHHNLSAQQLIDLYHRASLFAMPARYEPWGLVYLEAQLAAVPVLGSDRCAFPELSNYGQTGFTVPSLTADGVSAALLRAHSDPETLRQMGQEAVSFASEFTWLRTARRIAHILGADRGGDW